MCIRDRPAARRARPCRGGPGERAKYGLFQAWEGAFVNFQPGLRPAAQRRRPGARGRAGVDP
eukprot:72827-Alexandrium_andersonii.AAC.1